MKQAVILAGGKGTRLAERLQGLPKPLIDIGGKPLLERQIEHLKQYGFEQILILVNHGADQIIAFCNNKQNFGIAIECLDDGKPLGTAGSTIQILPQLAENFLVVYGDTMFDIDLDRFAAFHAENANAGATLFLHPNDHPHDSDLVQMDEQNQITGFYPYPHNPNQYLSNLVNAGMYFFRKSALMDWQGNNAPLDFGKDLFPALIAKRVLLRGYNSPEYIKDCGTPKRLDKVCADLESGKITASNLRYQQKIVFLDRDGTINAPVDQLARAEQFKLLPGAASAIGALNKSGYRTVVVTNQPVIARGESTAQDVEQVHRKMETFLGQEGAYVDRIYYCPHHPDGGFPGEVPALKVACDCRKPAIGMLQEAQQALNANFSESWMIGDSTADLLTAKRAGVRSVLVETGNAGLDSKYLALPDYIAPNLPMAVRFILEDFPAMLSYCEKIITPIAPGDLIFLAGLARSGKSTLASCLKEALQNKGICSVILSADGWLKPVAQRGKTVLERYDLPALRKVLEQLATRQQEMMLGQPVYNKLAQQADGLIQSFIKPSDVVIVDGTIALHLAQEMGAVIMHRWYVQLDESLRRSRVLAQYALRGKSPQEAQAIYDSRQQDEDLLLEAIKNEAHLVLEPPFCFSLTPLTPESSLSKKAP
jgi:histidinol-phosphate phosphatase family protein